MNNIGKTWEEYFETLPKDIRESSAIIALEDLFKENQNTLKAVTEEYGIDLDDLFRTI